MITLEPMEREKYFSYLHVTEIKKKRDQRRLSRRKEAIQRRRENFELVNLGVCLNEDVGPQYGLWMNSLFPRVFSDLKKHSTNNNLLTASLFGQKLAFDFSFQKYMNMRELDSLCSQLKIIQRINMKADYPFDLWFTNYEHGSYYDQRLRRLIPDLDKSFINFHSKQLIDLFPKENLVYLSPDADTVLWNYDHDAVYVIGCIVDTTVHVPLTYNKSKGKNIKCVRLPIDECLEWYDGSKDLPLNQVVDILRHVKDTNNWRKAMKHVASRKWNKVKKEEHILQNIEALKKDFLIS
ncbi:Mitochondrial ribonuclease P protein 1-like protein [Leptotrombidium deliense]|uniref:RNA (guanine-9-)-methyltransferase domain-containing protein 1 n=1 Tax=Leptotrombidium deliense TaxID=299467 RepID=A0A443SNC7_9ACAR|nr:Mitochondrial ribonuclease P protein 1-like protein [Leptotrombidium deliense]